MTEIETFYQNFSELESAVLRLFERKEDRHGEKHARIEERE